MVLGKLDIHKQKNEAQFSISHNAHKPNKNLLKTQMLDLKLETTRRKHKRDASGYWNRQGFFWYYIPETQETNGKID